ncbi:MutL C terminal dimerisation domain [Nesidiocoris tenuis]|uniref:MutL C terminal dimerisation domain n=1 Tax=Nesidiocoris tenuis TaxID=355587 RepID=A0ABN7AVH5_9HEMI|nr:MutL C terminal dimerisation domain [Nesidiocoris tenuis]
MLENLRIIGQVNAEFIATSLVHEGNRYLVLLDQHAVDERIRLERLRLEFGNDKQLFKRESLNFPIKLTIDMTEKHAKLVMSGLAGIHRDLQASGILCSIERCAEGVTALIREAPLQMLRKIIKRDSYENYLTPVKDVVTKTVLNEANITDRLSGRTMLFSHVLATEACARAIKFGHALDRQAMDNLLLGLAQCHLPFQCAHGRPTLQVVHYPN